ncbi:ATP-binding protein [uncultured Marinobacter sp.]|uniref:sensor histidine kinase n=1 Tax=uncultured Marinobacter sp. TaxID=187379 RepID=UPI002630D410|nr:ATP-binding protein [uncultured Marinobacter sp.]
MQSYSYNKNSLLTLYRLLLLLAWLIPASLLADPLKLGKDIPYSALADPMAQFSLARAVEKLTDQSLDQHSTFSRGYTNGAFWLRFELPETAFAGADLWMEVGPNFLDDLKIFARPIGGDEPWLSKRAGDLTIGQADLNYRKSVFILAPPVSNAKGYEVIVRVQSSSATIVQANLWRPAEFLGHATRSTSFWSFFLGLATLSTTLALVLAIVIGGTLLWSAVAFSTSFLLVAAIQGYISWLLPQFGAELQHYLTGILTLSSYSTLLWLSAETARLRLLLSRTHKLLITLSAMILSLVVLIPLEQYGLAIRILSCLFLLGAVVFICAVAYKWRRSNFNVTTLLLCATPIACILGGLFALLSLLGLVPFNGEIYVIWQYVLITLVLLVMATAVFRVREQKLKELEKSQLASELKAERDASFHQRQFMGMVSHEFRTPLAVISGALENLVHLEGGANSVRTGRYGKIRRATDRLVSLTDNCLADARLAADNLYVDPKPTKLIDLVRSASELAELSSAHNLQLTAANREIEGSGLQDWTVIVDTALIRIALSNVIDNAVKHSEGGLIRVDCSSLEGLVAIRICDEGQGIEDTSWIFERYRRGDHVRRGAGLGLFVAREISRAHGGDLRVVLTSRQGSCFELTFQPGEENSDS